MARTRSSDLLIIGPVVVAIGATVSFSHSESKHVSIAIGTALNDHAAERRALYNTRSPYKMNICLVTGLDVDFYAVGLAIDESHARVRDGNNCLFEEATCNVGFCPANVWTPAGEPAKALYVDRVSCSSNRSCEVTVRQYSGEHTYRAEKRGGSWEITHRSPYYIYIN